MLTKLLDIIAALAVFGAVYYSYTQVEPSFDLTHVFLMTIGITVFGLSAVIKDNYVDFVHTLVSLAFGYFAGVLVASGYLICVLLVRRYVYAQVSLTVLFSMGVFFLTA